MRLSRWVPVGLLVLAVPQDVGAVNELRKRTPANFTDTPCMTVIDKSTAPVFHIDYAVPFDDVMVGLDEVDDSRTMQFFAFSKQRFDYLPPTWITMADVQRSIENGDVMASEVVPDDVLETSSLWPPGSWVRITADDMRLPITLERAAMGVDWDTSTVPAGDWVIGVYTWEPKSNIWSWRFGAVRVIDDAGTADAAGPAAFLEHEIDALATTCEPHVVRGCIDAAPGSTYRASWGVFAGDDEPQWIPFAENVAVVDGDIALDLVLPSDVTDKVKVRLDVEDPHGHTYTAFSPAFIAVRAGDVECEAEDLDGGDGCDCAASSSGGGSFILIVLAAARRRRRQASPVDPPRN